MPLNKTKAILLKIVPYLDNNAILKTFTPHGMMDFMAYGIKKKQPHLLNPSTILLINYYSSTKSSMHTIKEADHFIRLKHLSRDITGTIFLSELARTIQIVGKEAQPTNEFDNLIIHPLVLLDQKRTVVWLAIPWLIVHLLRLSGLLNIDMFSKELKTGLAFLAKHKFTKIIDLFSKKEEWQSINKTSDLISSLANYYQHQLRNRTTATELRKIADRILLY
ncbi:MAG: hypothetical protein GXO48_06750 [Chlorobi bacterium]|nr:hypothetical protein [Chlorobiota bacterium]